MTETTKESGTQPGGISDLWSRPGFLIRRLHQLHVAIFLEECRVFNVTPVQYAVLSVLYRASDLDQISVAGAVGIDRNNAADVIRRLERRGFLERIPSPRDRRSRLARISDSGRTFVEEVHEAMERSQRRLTRGLTEQETDQFLNLLQKVMRNNNEAGRAPLRAGRIEQG